MFAFLLLLARTTGLVYIFAGVGKLSSRATLLNTIQALPFLPDSTGTLVARNLPWLELLLGTLLIMGAFSWYAAWVSLALLFIFSLIAILAVVKGADIPCSCFGTFSQESLSSKTVVRNSFLALLTLPLAIAKQASPLSFDALLNNPSNGKLEDFVVIVLMTLITVGLSVLIANAQHVLAIISAVDE